MSCENAAISEAADLVRNGIEDDQTYLDTLRIKRELVTQIKLAGDINTPTVIDAIDVLDYLSTALQAYEDRRGFAERKGEWMPTYSGRLFWLLDPRADEVEPLDIARGLSRIARFNGATQGTPYSVAQHSLLGAMIAPDWAALPFMVHDAHETYIGDQTSPWKKAVCSNLKDVETPIKNAIAERFGFEWTEEVEEQVKEIDNMLLATETRDLVPCGVLYGESKVEPFNFRIEPMGSELAEVLYLQKLAELVSGDD